MKKENNYFSSNLRFLRQREGLDQVDLAKKLGRKSSASISEWEKGKYAPKASVLAEIATIFDVSLSELLMVEEDEILNVDPVKLKANIDELSDELNSVAPKGIEYITIEKNGDKYKLDVTKDDIRKIFLDLI